MLPSDSQATPELVPVNGCSRGEIMTGEPPPAETFHNARFFPKPTQEESGDQNGLVASSVPAISLAPSLSRSRIHSRFPLTNASRLPSGEMASGLVL